MIGIIGAMDEEISVILSEMNNISEYNINNILNFKKNKV